MPIDQHRSDTVSNPVQPRRYSPLNFVIILAIMIFLTELVSMAVLLYYLKIPNYFVELLVDGFIMLALLVPGLYFLQLKPLLNQIEERKRAEKALRANEQLLSDVLEQLPVGVWILDEKGKILQGNTAIKEIWSGARYVGPEDYHEYKGWWPDTRQQVKTEDWAASRTLASGKAILEEEVEIEDFAGNRKYMLNSTVPIFDEERVLKNVLVVNQDISARKKMERDLQQTEALFRTALEALPVGVWLADANGEIIYGNPAGQQIWCGARFVGPDQYGDYKGWWAETGKPIEPDEWASARAIRNQETSVNEELEIECFDGTHKRILNSAFPLFDSQKNVSGVFVVNQDVTAIRRAEQEMLRVNALLERIFESIEILLVYMDRDFNFIRVNKAYADAAGYAVEYFTGKNYFALRPNAENEAIFRNVVETGESFTTLEKPFEYPDHPERGVTYWDWSLLPVKGAGQRVEGLVLSLVDVTERRRSEDQFADQYQELLKLSLAEHQQRELTESLMRATLKLNTSLEPDRVLCSIMEEVRKAIPFAGAGVVFLEGRMIRLVGYLGFEGHPQSIDAIEQLHEVDQLPLFDQIRSTYEPVLVDLDANNQWMKSVPGFEWVCSYLAAPLIVDHDIHGVILLTGDQPESFSQENVDQLKAFAAPAALALHNAYLFEQLRTSTERLQLLARQLVTVQEQERQSIARELHDEASQALSSLRIGLSRLEQDPDSSPRVSDRLSELKILADDVLEELHRLAVNLRPAALDHLGLVAALKHYADNFNSDQLTVRFKALGFDQKRLSRDLEISLYRIVQEALTNVVRHAHASSVGILLERSEGKIRLFVEDDGVGMPTDQTQPSGRLGLVGMRERAEMIGGSLTIESTAGKGTTILVEVLDDN